MPRAKSGRTSNGADGVSAADLEEMQTALAGVLPTMAVTAWPEAEWSALAVEVVGRGYVVTVSPQMDGRAVKVSVPVGTGRLTVTAGNDRELLEALRALLLQVRRLPARH